MNDHLPGQPPETIKRVVVLGDYEGVLTTALQQGLPPLGYEVNGYSDAEKNPEVLHQRLTEAQVVVVIRERTPLPEVLLRRLPALELIVTTGTNTSVIDLAAGVPVAHTRSQVSAAAEHTWALILALARHVPEEASRLRAGLWQHSLGLGLEGKTLGLLGLGRVGARVAAVARAFNMRLLAWSPNMTAERAGAQEAEYADLEELFSRADIVSLHLRLSDRTRGLVAEGLLSRSTPGMLLVNTARAGLLREDDVVQALESGRLGGLAQDVYEIEPLPRSSPLLRAPRTLLTPHLGYVTDDNFSVFAQDVRENIVNFYAGRPVRRLNA